MIEVGKKQLLTVVKKVDFGVYLSDSLEMCIRDRLYTLVPAFDRNYGRKA